jgi:hypothetical protein
VQVAERQQPSVARVRHMVDIRGTRNRTSSERVAMQSLALSLNGKERHV